MFNLFANAARTAHKKYLVLSVITATLLFSAVPAMPAEGNSMQLNRVVAVVNGELITMYALQQQAMQEIMRQGITGNDRQSAMEREKVFMETMDTMILEVLYKQEAERYNVSIEDGEVDNELRRIMQSNNLTQEEFDRQLRLQGMNMADLRARVRDGMMRQRIVGLMVGRKAEVTPADVEKYYMDNQEKFTTSSGVEFSVIMLGPGKEPARVYEEISSGAISFADAAKKYSDSPTAAIGGRMGNIAWRDLNPTWRSAMEGLKAGETASPVDAGGTTIILHVDAVNDGNVRPLEAVRSEIEEELRTDRLRERFEEYNAQLRSKAVVDIKL